MKLGKKIIALIAAFLMVFGNISFTVSAEDANPGKEFGFFSSYLGGLWGHSHDGAGSYTPAGGDTFYSSAGNKTFKELTDKSLAYVTVKCANTYVLFKMSGGSGTPKAYVDGDARVVHSADSSIITPEMLSVSVSGGTVTATKGANVTLPPGDCFLGGISHIAVFYSATVAPVSHVTVSKTIDNYASGDAAASFTFDLYAGGYTAESQLAGKTPLSTITLDVNSAAAASKVFPADLPYGTYTVYERALSGYTVVGSALKTTTTGAGAACAPEETVYFHNNRNEAPKGHITVSKTLDNFVSGDGTASFQFDLYAGSYATPGELAGRTPVSSVSIDVNSGAAASKVFPVDLPYGAYTVFERTLSGYTVVGSALQAANVGASTPEVTAYYHNTKDRPPVSHVTVSKTVTNYQAGDAMATFTFDLYAGGYSAASQLAGKTPLSTITLDINSAAAASKVFPVDLPYGTYTVYERAFSGYTVVGSALKTTVTGAAATCAPEETVYFQNTKDAPPKGHITVSKTLDNFVSGDGTATFWFDLYAGGYSTLAELAGKTPVSSVSIDVNSAAAASRVFPADLPYGTYTVVERVLSGYTVVGSALKTTVIGVAATCSPEETVAFHNTKDRPKGSVLVKKTYSDGFVMGAEGVTFRLIKNGAQVQGDKTITKAMWDANHDATVGWTGLDYGSYTVLEVNADVNYTVSFRDAAGNTLGGGVIAVAGNQTVTCVNTRKADGSIKAVKVFDGSWKPEQDIVLKLINTRTGADLGTKTISKNAWADGATLPQWVEWTGLSYDSYRIEEVNGDANYTASYAPAGGALTLDALHASGTVTVTNTRKADGSIKVAKLYGAGWAPEGDLAFRLTNTRTGAVVGTKSILRADWIADLNNQGLNSVEWTDLPYDSYRVEEIVGDSNFAASYSPANGGISLSAAQPSGTVTVTNTRKADGSIKAVKVFDGSWKPEQDIQLKLVNARTGADLGTKTISKNAWADGATLPQWVEWTGLPYDSYRIEEINGDANYTASYSPAGGALTLDAAHASGTVTVTNTRKADGSVTLTKVYADGSAPAQDLAFRLTRTRDGADMGSRSLSVADWAAGKRTVEWTGLEYDEYTVAETAGDADYAASFTPGNRIAINYANASAAVTVTNTKKADGSIKVTKLFAGGYAPEQDLEFRLKTAAGAVIGTQKILKADWKADPSNQGLNYVQWINLTYGSYVVEEINGDADFTASYFPTNAITLNNQTPSGAVTVTNTRMKGLLSIHKDVTGAPAGGDTTVFHFNIKGTGFPAAGQDFTLTDNTVLPPFQVDYGTYTITETNLDAAPGYRFVDFTGGNGTLDAANHSYTVTVGANGAAPIVNVTANNLKLAQMHLVKLDSVTGQPPVGSVRFSLDRTDDSSAQTWTADTDPATGLADVSNLEPGTYRVTEVSAPAGYDLAPAQDVTLAAGQTATVTFRDTPNGWLKLVKTDSDTGAGIDGVTFRLADNAAMTDSAAFPARTLTTTGGGIVADVKLAAGTYWVQETGAPAGYVIDGTPRQVTIELNKVNTVTFTNTPQGWIEIYKTSTLGGPVAGVTFTLQRQHANVLAGAWAAIAGDDASYNPITVTTDANGYLKSGAIVPGTYTVTETAAPAGYVMDTAPRTVTVSRNTTTRLDYANRPEGSAEVTKLDAQNGAGIDGATFELSANASFDPDVSPVITATSAAGGKALFTHLLPGTYYIRETAAAPGYRFDPAVVKTAVVTLGGTAAVSFDNTPEGTLALLKRDSATGLGVDGVAFDLSVYADMHADAAHPVQRLVTANGGHINADLEQGTYYLREASAPAGYVVDNTIHAVLLTKGQTASLTLDNTPQGWLEIRKTDSKTGAGIAGVTFQAVRNVNPVADLINSMVGSGTITLVTGEGGLIKSDALIPGMYTVTEISAPAGYLVDRTPRDVLVALGQTAHIDVTNTPQGFLKLKKTDSDTGLGVDGVTFKLADNAGMTDSPAFQAQTLTTAGGGWIATGELDAGTYYLQETAAPAGYIVDGTVHPVTVSLNATAELSLSNVPQSWIEILKTDSQTGTGIAGVTFRVQRQSNALMNAVNAVLGTGSFTLTTGEGGIIKSDAIVPGTYTVTELSAPAGYLIDSTPRTVTVALNETAHLDFQNRPEGTVEIIKTDAATGGRLDGITFQVSADSAFGANSTVYTVVTAADGSAKAEHLLPGTYYVRETAAPTGYSFDPALVKSVTVALGQSARVEFADDPVGWLEVRKVDSVFGTPMSGVKFGVYATLAAANADTNNTGAGALQTLTTGANGSAVSDPLVVTNPSTDFFVKELSALPGYVADHSVHTVTVNYATRVQDRQPNPVVLSVSNTPLGGLQLLKVDSLDNTIKLKNAAFALYADEAQTELVGEQTTGYDGVAQWTGLAPGDYWLVETQAPEGYVLNDAAIPVSVRPDADLKILNGMWFKTITVLNEANPPQGFETGDLKIIKTDALTGKRLPGATFKIFADEARTDLVAEETTDKNGEILLEGLDPATYWVVETKAPADYVLNSTPVSVKVEENKLNVITLVNEYHPPEGVQTGMMDYNIVLAGGAVLIVGLAFLTVGMRRRGKHERR